MKLWDEAEKISLMGIEVYRYGFFVAMGMLAFALVIGFLSWARRCEKGTAPLLVLTSFLLGGICSRVLYCSLSYWDHGFWTPVSEWFRISGGGWSMMGLIGGVLLAGLISARLTRQNTGLLLDLAVCGLPAFMALERIGEGCIPEFNLSRQLETGLLDHSFLAVRDAYGTANLATWRLCAIVMCVLFAIMIIDMIRSRRDGNTAIAFLLLYGGAAVILESLRYDWFMSWSFVKFQQILAAVLMEAGIIAAAVRAGRACPGGLKTAGILSVPIAAALGVGIEFALDRTMINKILLYAAFILVIAVPIVLGLMIRAKDKT